MVELHLSILEDGLLVREHSQAGQVSSEDSLDQGHCSLLLLVGPLDLEHPPVTLDCDSRPKFLLSMLLGLYQQLIVRLYDTLVSLISLLLVFRHDDLCCTLPVQVSECGGGSLVGEGFQTW